LFLKFKPIALVSLSSIAALVLAGCGTQNIGGTSAGGGINEYEATAVSTITWRVNYSRDPSENKQNRYEKFESASLTNRNGEQPEGGIVCPQKQDIWCPKIPPQPTVDEIEARRKAPYEKMGKPERLWEIKYYITYQQDGQTLTLPTNYEVYRQVVKAYPNQTPLQLTMGINNGSVEKAVPIQ
jgi:hypothetical protein